MRYIPHSETDIKEMLQKVGAKSVDDLFEQIPEELRFKKGLDLPPAMSEAELIAHLQQMSGGVPADGKVPFMGAGAYCHHVSPAVDQILLRSEFYTAYTPYQPEVSQGTLQAIFEFQSIICRVFNMAVANASMYDGATAATEAALMARRVTKRDRIVVSAGIHPETIETLKTYLRASDNDNPNLTVVGLDEKTGATDLGLLEKTLSDDVACVITGYPNFYGVVERLDEISSMARNVGALSVSATQDPFAFGVIAPPGDLDVDIATGEGQALGVPISYGGPGVGLFCIRDDKKLLRQMPGRLTGQTVDSKGEMGFVLTLSTREQHIRREKATSNICTNHGLCALAVGVNLSLLGKSGFTEVAESCLARAEFLKNGISGIEGFKMRYEGPTFNEFAIRCEGRKAADVLTYLEDKCILGGVDLGRFDSSMDDTILVAVTECITCEALSTYLDALKSL